MKPTQHRNLFTGDCTYLFQDNGLYHPVGVRYDARVFQNHVAQLAASGVDTYVINPNTQVAWYPSRAVATALDGYTRGDREYVRPQAVLEGPKDLETHLGYHTAFLDRYLDLIEDGIDWLAVTVAACREHGISPWVTVRMNDMHGSAGPAGSYMNCPLFRDAGNRLSGNLPNPRDGERSYFAGLNFALPAVRDYMFAMIRELVEEYDIDGVELDWLRNPLCCEPEATPADTDTMTEWHAQLRGLTNARAARIGRPVPLGIRMPGSLPQMRSIGLDVRAMAKADLIDFIGPSNFWQTSWDIPIDRLQAALGHGVAIYGVLEGAPNWLQGVTADGEHRGTRMLPASPQLMRGNAAGKLVLGAAGVETFNFFCADSAVWTGVAGADYDALRGLENLEDLRGQDKHYALSTMNGLCWIPPFESCEQLPAIIEVNWRRSFQLSMCAEPAGCELTVQVVVARGADPAPEIGVSFNGAWPNFSATATMENLFPVGPYTHHPAECMAFNFTFPASVIDEGWNEVVVYNGGTPHTMRGDKPTEPLRIVSLELAVTVK